ncbi:MAG: adenylosuccinate synthase [Candidatus Poribacteria bacterium]|nr:adenylosuccinate synthase [Candidatus Poribacteria bacterium]
MANIVILGAQWGDESKGGTTDFLAENADIVARYQGGDNAGHTIVVGEEKFIFHLLPSGLLRPHTTNVIGNGVVINLETLFAEINELEGRGIEVGGRLKISSRAHLILPYHKAMESWDDLGSGLKLGTTSRGIGPTYSDKVNRHAGIRVGDLVEFDLFQKKLDFNLTAKDHVLNQIGGDIDKHALLAQYYDYSQRLAPYVVETPEFMNNALKSGKRILFEGAQGTMLDIDFGTYPYVTSSNTTVGAVCTGLGVGPQAIDQVLGVSKAYVTRVGSGPFPTEMPPDLDEEIRGVGEEYGATTQRPRRCGWLDLVVLHYAAQINGFTGIVLTKFDVLDHLDEIQVCTAYQRDGEPVTAYPSSLRVLDECKPVYETLPGWKQSTADVRRYEALPANAKRYLSYIAEFLDLPIVIVSVGKERTQKIICDNDLFSSA